MLTRNSDIVRVNYDTCLVAAGNQGMAGSTVRSVLVFGHHYRLRQFVARGETLRIKIYIAALTTVTEFYIRIFRKVGSTYYVIHSTGNILSSLTAGQINTIDTVVTADLREGDMWEWRIVNSNSAAAGLLTTRTAQTNAGSWYAGGVDPDGTVYESYTWVNLYVVPIELYAVAPHMVGIGDSIMSGSLDHVSYADTTVEAVYSGTTKVSRNHEFNRPGQSLLGLLRRLTGNTLVYQNMGIGGNKSADVVARYATDVEALKPRYVLYSVGSNDLYTGVAKATFLANMTTCLDADVAAGRYAIVLGLFPGDHYTNDTMYADRYAWNSDLEALCATKTGAYFIDPDPVFGYNRAAGPAGNLDWMHPDYAIYENNIHLSAAGNYRLAQMVNTIITTIDNIGTPKRQQILDAIKARLQTILIANGYKTDMGSNVFVHKETPFTEAEMEGVDIRYSDTPDQQIGYEEHTLSVECLCALMGNDSTTNVTNAGADIITAIGTDRTWGGLAEETGVVTAERAQIGAGEHIYQGASVKFDVTYTTDHMDAYP